MFYVGCRLVQGLGFGVYGVGGFIEVILGLYWDNGKENGNYSVGFRV